MTLHVLSPRSRTAVFRRPEDVVEALGIPFSDQQLTAITAPLEPGVIIAGAGSGKTTVMAARVVWLVGTGAVQPEEVLGLTFTRKAAAELSVRVRGALDRAGVVADRGVDEAGEQLIMTYDAFAGRLVTEHGLRVGCESDPTMISGATRYRLASRVVRSAAGPFEFLSRLRPDTITERVLKLDGDLQQHLVPPTRLDRHTRETLLGWESAPLNARGNVFVDVKRAALSVQERLELASLVTEYQQLKRRLGLVEYADQMAVAARLVEQVPAVSGALRAAYRVVLLDEYQDTSAAQAVMLRGLFSGHSPSSGRGHPVTAVGDPFQAIYGWRGAAASNITSFADDFPRADGHSARRFELTVNRRSGGTILDVANVLSTPLRAGLVTLGGGEAGLLEAPPGTPPGQVRAAVLPSWQEEMTWIGDQVVAAKTAGEASTWADIAVLTRRNADIAALYGELVSRDVPVEIVGLGGLLHLPEIMDVTATLRVVGDVTANPDLIRLLTGPRWQIGPRDLALLGRRARELSRQPGSAVTAGADELGLSGALEQAVADVDPTEVVSLLDALEDPGEAAYSTQARERFGLLASELAMLRRHSDEPVVDLTRRVIGMLGLDVELEATPEFALQRRRDQLGAFLDAIAAYTDVDGDGSLTGLLAYLQAEIEQGVGLEQAVPSDRDAVKLLTVHKAKGLEWAVVFLPALVNDVFPSERVTDNWVLNPAALPADLRGDAASIPQLADTTNAALVAYKARLKEEQRRAEDRLAYVAVTRAKRLLVGSGYVWRADVIRPRTPSDYLKAIMAEAERQGQLLARAEPTDSVNPLIAEAPPRTWPQPLDPDGLARRTDAAQGVERAQQRFRRTGSYADPAEMPLLLDEESVAAGWDTDLEQLLAEATQLRQADSPVQLPSQLSATSVLQLRADPQAYAAALARPIPRPPSRAARFGTRFHLWVERYFRDALPTGGLGQQVLIDPDELTERADFGQGDDTALRELCKAFTSGRFGSRVPYAVEAPFSLAIGGRLIRGRIDAVYALGESDRARFLIVDWKTTRAESADPWQLALYRIAWAEANGLPLDQVEAAFYYVRSDELSYPADLPDRPEVERLFASN